MKISTLELEWKHREGGGGRTERNFLDFIIDGQSLSEIIDGDFASCLGWYIPEENEKAVNQLMLKTESDLPNNRYILYICPECGDIGCGAITVSINRNNDVFIWSEFGYQNDYDSEIQPIEEIGSFSFDRVQYRNALKKAL